MMPDRTKALLYFLIGMACFITAGYLFFEVHLGLTGQKDKQLIVPMLRMLIENLIS